MSAPQIVVTRRFDEALDALVGTPAASACYVALAALLADLAERDEPGRDRGVVEREPHVFGLPFEGGTVIYELGREHTREAPVVILAAIEREG